MMDQSMAAERELTRTYGFWEGVKFVVFMGINIAEIVIGALYLHQCLLEPKIPIYLVVNGVVNILIISIGFFLEPHLILYALMRIMALFSFCWLITGSIWTFPHFTSYYDECNNILYIVTFSSLIIQYAFIFMLLIFTIFTVSSSRYPERMRAVIIS
ncbi:transmembrane protein 272-like [Ambystoma mexicanum]|uniref:transmembrane protein 272-like n=1 Tax=Ambystoma mexicanum TaxID=8296 RepID=UPI0037E7C736